MRIYALTQEKLDAAQCNIILALQDMEDLARLMKSWRHDYPYLESYTARFFLKASRELNSALEAIAT